MSDEIPSVCYTICSKFKYAFCRPRDHLVTPAENQVLILPPKTMQEFKQKPSGQSLPFVIRVGFSRKLLQNAHNVSRSTKADSMLLKYYRTPSTNILAIAMGLITMNLHQLSLFYPVSLLKRQHCRGRLLLWHPCWHLQTALWG